MNERDVMFRVLAPSLVLLFVAHAYAIWVHRT